MTNCAAIVYVRLSVYELDKIPDIDETWLLSDDSQALEWIDNSTLAQLNARLRGEITDDKKLTKKNLIHGRQK